MSIYAICQYKAYIPYVNIAKKAYMPYVNIWVFRALYMAYMAQKGPFSDIRDFPIYSSKRGFLVVT